MPVVASDGPAGSGKSTVARAVADRLGIAYLDTGAMYRSVAFAALGHGVDPTDSEALAKLASGLDIQLGERVLVDGVDATGAIRGPDVTAIVSTVAAHPAVRAEMVRRQRSWASEHGGGAARGRDIGPVVIPPARLQAFLTARADRRAPRRQRAAPAAGPTALLTHLAPPVGP